MIDAFYHEPVQVGVALYALVEAEGRSIFFARRSKRDLGSSSSHAATGGFQLSRVHSRTLLAADSWYPGGLLLESVKRCSSSTSQCPAPGGDNPTPPIALSRFYLASSGRPPGQTGVFSTRERPPTQSSTKGKTATRSPKKSLGRNNPSAL